MDNGDMTDLYRKQAQHLGCPSNQDWMSCTANGFYMLYKDKDYSAGDRDRIANLQQFCKVCKALDATDIPDRYIRHDADGNLWMAIPDGCDTVQCHVIMVGSQRV